MANCPTAATLVSMMTEPDLTTFSSADSDQTLLTQIELGLLSIRPQSSLYCLLGALRELATRFFERGLYPASQLVERMEACVEAARQNRKLINGDFVRTLIHCTYFLQDALAAADHNASLQFSLEDLHYQGIDLDNELTSFLTPLSNNFDALRHWS